VNLLQVIKQIKHHFCTRQFFLFLLVGCINTFNCTIIAYLLSGLVPDANLAFNIGYLSSLSIAYWLNCKLIFKQAMAMNAYLKFALSYIPNFIIQNIIVFIFYNQLAFPPVISYLTAAIIGVPVTFLIVKIFAFGQK